MASDSDDADAAANRLEAALERIALAAARAEPDPVPVVRESATEEIAARLDSLIDRLRSALGKSG